jgi:ketosteroid isomerase-like protein/uncharacterized protein YciI
MPLTRRTIAIVILTGVALGPRRASAGPPAGDHMGVVYVAFLKRGPASAPDETPEAKAIQEAHMANIRSLWAARKLIISGPVRSSGDLRGLFVLQAGSAEEARSLVADDPAVKAGHLTAEVVPWWVETRALPEAGSYCSSVATPGSGADLPAPLARVLTDYEDAWQRKDAAALAALFAEDGFVLSSGSPPVRGRAAIEKHYEGAGGPLALHAFDYATEGSTGYILGGFSRQKGEPDVGKFTLTLRRGDHERWLIVSDMDNGNARP